MPVRRCCALPVIIGLVTTAGCGSAIVGGSGDAGSTDDASSFTGGSSGSSGATGGTSGGANGSSASGSGSGASSSGTGLPSSSGSSGSSGAGASGSSASSSGANDGGGPPPEAYVSVVVGAGVNTGVNDVPACGRSVPFSYQIGAATAFMPMVYADGTNHAGAVSVYCAVDPSGSGFDVNLSAELAATNGGTISVSGHVNATGSTPGLSATFETMGQLFRDNDCTFTLTYNGSPLAAGGAPAAGRIWGHIDCPNAAESGMFGMGPDGGTITRTCEGTADLLFENCQ